MHIKLQSPSNKIMSQKRYCDHRSFHYFKTDLRLESLLLIVVLITVPIIRESNNKLLDSVLIVLTVRVVGNVSRGGGCDQVRVEVGVRV